jgi:hypothetical protein
MVSQRESLHKFTLVRGIILQIRIPASRVLPWRRDAVAEEDGPALDAQGAGVESEDEIASSTGELNLGSKYR